MQNLLNFCADSLFSLHSFYIELGHSVTLILYSRTYNLDDGMDGVMLVELVCGGMQCWERLCAARRCSPMPWAAAASYTATLAVGMAHSSCYRDRVL